jgi:sugar transferase (PEP-CTERM/EpsH1 system associated)
MRIFYVAQRVPFPPDRGDKIATYNEVRHLSRAHEVHVFCTADGAEDMENVAGVEKFAASVTAVPVHGWWGRVRALLALFTGAPLSVAMMNERALHDAVAGAHAALRPDLIIVYSSNVAQYVERFAATVRIMQFADLDSLKWTRYAARSRPLMRWIYAIEGRRLLAYERRIAHSFSHSLVCTEAERRDFEAAIPGAPVSIVRNGVDLDVFRPGGTAKVSGRILFTGVMDYFPNVDAVTWFVADILPRVRDEMPEAHLVICGSRPLRAVRALAARPGVTVTGRVPDVRPYLQAAEIFVAPLRIARGIQNKVLEAMAMGLPVVASVDAWAGTAIPRGEGIEVADHPADYVRHILRLLRDSVYRDSMATAARSAVERDYAWPAQMQLLDEVIARALRCCQPRACSRASTSRTECTLVAGERNGA